MRCCFCISENFFLAQCMPNGHDSVEFFQKQFLRNRLIFHFLFIFYDCRLNKMMSDIELFMFFFFFFCCDNSFYRRYMDRKCIKKWSRAWLLMRSKRNHQVNLLKNLQLNEVSDYQHFLLMDPTTFEFLLTKISPLIMKQDTNMRKAISPKIRLIATIRWLITG